MCSGPDILNSVKNCTTSSVWDAQRKSIGNVILTPSLNDLFTSMVTSGSCRSAPMLNILDVDMTMHWIANSRSIVEIDCFSFRSNRSNTTTSKNKRLTSEFVFGFAVAEH